jgi:predicted HTH domain antitoxin
VYARRMQVTFTIPDDLAARIVAAGKDPARAALEALAVEGYPIQRLSESEVRRLLGYETRIEVHELLAAHEVCLHYTADDLAIDAQTSQYIRSLRSQESAQRVG